MPAWVVERLKGEHDRSQFDCGRSVLNEWLILRSGQFERKDLARTYVALRPSETRVLGYYALSTHRVVYSALPQEAAKGLPNMDVPVVLLGRLAVDRTVQGAGLGAFLLIDALRRVQHVADEIGIRAIEVDALDQSAREFYLKFGFEPLADDPQHLFLTMRAIRKLNLPPFGKELDK